MWMLLMLPALAGSLGVPIPDPDASRVALSLVGQTEAVAASVSSCVGDSGCDMSLDQSGLGGELSVAIVRGLGLYGGFGRVNDSVATAGYTGTGTGWTLGARGAIPVYGKLGIAADFHLGTANTEGEHVTESDQQQSAAVIRERAARLLATVGEPEAGAVGWAGAELAWGWSMDLTAPPTEGGADSVSYAVEPTGPASFVVGGSLHSEPIGVPWRPSPTLSAGAELRFGQIRSVGAWVGLGF